MAKFRFVFAFKKWAKSPHQSSFSCWKINPRIKMYITSHKCHVAALKNAEAIFHEEKSELVSENQLCGVLRRRISRDVGSSRSHVQTRQTLVRRAWRVVRRNARCVGARTCATTPLTARAASRDLSIHDAVYSQLFSGC